VNITSDLSGGGKAWTGGLSRHQKQGSSLQKCALHSGRDPHRSAVKRAGAWHSWRSTDHHRRTRFWRNARWNPRTIRI